MMPLKSTVTKPPKTLATKQAVTNIKDLLDFGLLFVFAFFLLTQSLIRQLSGTEEKEGVFPKPDYIIWQLRFFFP